MANTSLKHDRGLSLCLVHVRGHILREDGPRGLFRGYLSTCLRDAPFMVVLFFSYEQFKS